MAEKSYLEAVREAHHEVMTEYDEAVVLGEDVRKGLMGATTGLVDEFGETRVRDAPISEQAFTGLAVGAAARGKRPIVEYQINSLVHVAFEQIMDQAGIFNYVTAGATSMPITLTVPMTGAPGASGAQHSYAPYAPLLPYGIKTVVPSTGYDAKGLFHAAVAEDDPVLVCWPVALQGRHGEVPDEPFTIPLGEADVKREGEDVTVVATGRTIIDALDVADRLEGEIDVEVVDPRSLLPLDETAIFESVEKTGRLVVVDDTNRTCGFAAEVVARVANEGFWDLAAPLKRVTRADVPISHSPPEEARVLPDAETLERAVRDVTNAV